MSNVRNLFALNSDRRATLERFYADQALFFMQQIANPAGGAAAISISVTGDGHVEKQLAAVGPATAAVLLAELDIMRAQLVQYVTEQAPELLEKDEQVEPHQVKASNVVPINVLQ